MCIRDRAAAADAIENAVGQVVTAGYRCHDIATGDANEKVVNTKEMGAAVLAALSGN